MRDGVTIFYRGASYGLGRGPGCYGIWRAAEQGQEPLERWPQTPEGWAAAWARLTQIEPSATIVPVGPVAPAAQPAGQTRSRARSVVAAAVTGAGVALGIAGLFPGYLAASSLASQPEQLVPHVMYLAAWTVSAVLVLLGGARQRVGSLIGLGTSALTLGLFLADVGEAVAGATSLAGAGLALVLAGWLACTVGVVIALGPHPTWAVARRGGPRPAGHQIVPVVTMMLAGLGAAIAFAPSWDSFTLRTAAGNTQTLTAGNVFANPAPVIAGDVLVMAALLVVVLVAGLWRPVRHGAALLAGAIVPLAAEAVSALVQAGHAASPAQFGISPGQAAQLGLTISSGLTLAFWIYCAFVLALVLSCAWMAGPPDPADWPGPAVPLRRDPPHARSGEALEPVADGGA